MKPGISVVIPCLNEEASVARVVEAAQAGVSKLGLPVEVIVVDNGSEDRSAAVALAAGARVVREARRGYGAAVRRGFAEARYDILVMADGDLSYDLTRLDELTGPVRAGTADFVVGNRLDGVQPGAMPKLHQHVGTPLLTWMLRLLFGCRALEDSQCGLRAIRRDVYERLECQTTGMEFASEMIVKATLAGARIAQCDIAYHRRAGTSKLRPLQDGWRHMRFMLLYLPAAAFLLPPLVVWMFSMAALLLLLLGPVTVGAQQFSFNSMLLAALLNLVSMQLLTGGMTARVYAHLSGFRRDPLIAWLYGHLRFRLPAILSAALLVLGIVGVGGASWRGVQPALLSQGLSRVLVFAMCCIVNGLQLWLGSYIVSIMAVPRHAGRLAQEAGGDGPGDAA